MMKTYLTAAAVATILLWSHLSAQAQQGAYPPVNYMPQQVGYAPPMGAMMVPGYGMPQPGVNLASLQQVAPAQGCADGCGDVGCQSGCDACGGDPCCCIKWEFFGDFLYLRPRSAEVAFAVPVNLVADPVDRPAIQVGPVAMVDPDYDIGFRVGGRYFMDPCASIGVEAWWYETNAWAAAIEDVTPVLQSLVSHPSTASADQPWQEARAIYDIDFQRINVDYRWIFSCSDRHEVAVVGGAAYANLDQDFAARNSVLGNQDIITAITFDGAGIRVGLEAERHAACSGLFVYGKGHATLLAGEFSARYFQGQDFDAEVVNTSWKAGRVVPVLDLELGLGWSSCSGCLRLSGGYLFSGWYNIVKTDEWINSVRANNFVGLSDKMTFDGLVARAEVRF